MITFNVSWNVTAGTLNWDDVTITHFNDGSQEQSSVPESKELTFTVNPSFTEEKHNVETITFQDQTEQVDIVQAPQPKVVVSTEYKIMNVTLTDLKS